MSNKQPFRREHVLAIMTVLPAAATLPFGESVIGVQIDAIAREFQASTTQVQWIVNAFMLTFATSILGAGILADRFGRRRLFAWGLALSLVANAAAVFAPSAATLVVLRALSGLGSGTIMATAPALISAQFSQPGRRRAVAFAALGAATGSGIALGPLIGGLIMSLGGWRTVFLVYLPFLLMSAFYLWRNQQPDEHKATPIDIPGMTLFTVALILLIWLIQEGGQAWGSVVQIAIIAALLLALFPMARRHPVPAIDPVLFANPVFGAMSLMAIINQISIAISMVYVPAMVVAGMGGSPALAGASVLPMAVALFASVPLGPKLLARAGKRHFLAVCVCLVVVGDVMIWATLGMGMPWSALGLMIGLTFMGMGGGTANGSMDNLALGTIDSARAGMASGVFQTVKIGAAAVCVAAAGRALGLAGDQPATAQAAMSLMERYITLAGTCALLMAVIGAVGVWAIGRNPKNVKI